jgi:hypothetical protein
MAASILSIFHFGSGFGTVVMINPSRLKHSIRVGRVPLRAPPRSALGVHNKRWLRSTGEGNWGARDELLLQPTGSSTKYELDRRDWIVDQIMLLSDAPGGMPCEPRRRRLSPVSPTIKEIAPPQKATGLWTWTSKKRGSTPATQSTRK